MKKYHNNSIQDEITDDIKEITVPLRNIADLYEKGEMSLEDLIIQIELLYENLCLESDKLLNNLSDDLYEDE